MATEVPLTKSQKNHLANIARRDANRRKRALKDQHKAERDSRLKEINDRYKEKIDNLKKDQRKELSAVWKEWEEKRSKTE